MPYQALVTDFDGTLYAGGGILSDININAIKKAVAAGKKVILCSGRMPKSLTKYEEILGLNIEGNFSIAFNGGAVYAHPTGQMLRQQFMVREKAFEILAVLRKCSKIEIFVFGANMMYSEKKEHYVDGIVMSTYIGDFASIPGEIVKILVSGSADVLEKLRYSISAYSVLSSKTFLEFLPIEVSKGRGVAFLADHMGIPLSEIIAVGDAENDASMLQAAGLGIAVANASDIAKAAADIVCSASCAENAVAKIIDEYLL